jgi:hypothetical protein
MHEPVYEHNPGDHEDPLPGSTWLVGGAGTILLAVVLFAVTALFYEANQQEFNVVYVNQPAAAFKALQARQEAVLHQPAKWVERPRIAAEPDGEKERVFVIPIERAMELIVAEHASAPAS